MTKERLTPNSINDELTKGNLLLKNVMADLIRHLPSAQAGFYDRRSRVKRGMTGVGERVLRGRFFIIDLFVWFKRNGHYQRRISFSIHHNRFVCLV